MANRNIGEPPDHDFGREYQSFYHTVSARISQKLQSLNFRPVDRRLNQILFQADFPAESEIFQKIQPEKMQSSLAYNNQRHFECK